MIKNEQLTGWRPFHNIPGECLDGEYYCVLLKADCRDNAYRQIWGRHLHIQHKMHTRKYVTVLERPDCVLAQNITMTKMAPIQE